MLLAALSYGGAYLLSEQLKYAGAAAGMDLGLASDIIAIITNVVFTAVVYAYATTNTGERLSLSLSMVMHRPPRSFMISALLLFAMSIGFSLLPLIAIAVLGLLGSALPLSFIEGLPPFRALGESVKRTSQYFLSIFAFNFLICAPLLFVLVVLTGLTNDLLSETPIRPFLLGGFYGFGIAALIYAQSVIYRELAFIEADTSEGRAS